MSEFDREDQEIFELFRRRDEQANVLPVVACMVPEEEYAEVTRDAAFGRVARFGGLVVLALISAIVALLTNMPKRWY